MRRHGVVRAGRNANVILPSATVDVNGGDCLKVLAMFTAVLLTTGMRASTSCAGQVQQRDSAGVAIVVVEPVAAPAYRLATDAFISIEIENRAGGVAFVNDSVIAAKNGSSIELVNIRTGRRLPRVGRAGQGPLEFLFLDGIYTWRGDSAAASDLNGYVEIFPIFGGKSRRVYVPRRYHPVGVLDGAHMLVASETAWRRDGDREIQTRAYYAFDAVGARLVSNALFEFPTGDFVRAGPRGQVRRLLPFGTQTLLAAAGDAVFHSSGRDYVLDEYDRTGRLRRSFRIRSEPPALTSRDRSNYVAAMREVERDVDPREYPRNRPALNGIVVSRNGQEIWLRRYSEYMGDPVNEWLVFQRNGAPLGIIRLPAGLELRAVTASAIAGIRTSELGVKFVDLYRIHR